jgi:protein ImuB
VARVEAGLEALGYTGCPGIAPTPAAAWLLARAGDRRPVISRRDLRVRLAAVPVTGLELPPRILDDLRDVGVHRFGDCCRLPRDGLARRFGPALVDCLDRVLGRRPDVRVPHVFPDVFERRVSWPEEVREVERVALAAKRLLEELAGFLTVRDQGLCELELHLAHGSGLATRVTLSLVSPSRDPGYLGALVEERLGRLSLAEPVVYLALRAAEVAPLAPREPDLYEPPGMAGSGWEQLVERLRARLGVSAVGGLAPFPDHRPERAWRPAWPAGDRPLADAGGARRPLWLLQRPRPLEVVAGGPCLGGRLLRLLAGPERLESGWWDGGDVSRDYYRAEGVQGSRYWVFRDRRDPGGWFLHGIFA